MPRPSGASHKEEMGLLKAQVVTLEAKLAACNIKVTDLDHVVAALQGEMGDYKLQTSATVKVCVCSKPHCCAIKSEEHKLPAMPFCCASPYALLAS